MPRALLIAAIALLASTLHAADAMPEVRWIGPDGEIAWAVALSGDAGEPTELLAAPWRPRLPDLEVELTDRSVFSFEEARGDVLVVNFWATWCRPCAEELPMLQSIVDAERERGIRMVAINVQESRAEAESFAHGMGLDLPIGRYRKAEEEAFRVRKLPTTILADREGRIHARWDGFEPGSEAVLRDAIERLLTDDPGRTERVGEVVQGAAELEAVWTRALTGIVDGLTVAGGDALYVAALREIRVVGGAGDILETLPSHAAAGRLRRAPDGEVIGFRRGSPAMVRFGADPQPLVIEAPAPLFDVELIPDGMLWATDEGLFRVEADGTPIEAVEGLTGVIDLARAGDGWLVLDRAGTLTRLDGGFRPVGRPHDVGPGAGALVAVGEAAGGVGVVPPVLDVAVGRFLDGDGMQIALATLSSELVLFDVTTGAERWRARWPGIGALAATDFDGDGRNELVVGGGRRLTLLRAR